MKRGRGGVGEGREWRKELRRQRSRSFSSFFTVCSERKRRKKTLDASTLGKRVFDPRACRSPKRLSLTCKAELGPSRTCRTRDKRPVAPEAATGAWTGADVDDDVNDDTDVLCLASKPLTRTAGGATAATAGEPRHVGLLRDEEGVNLALLPPFWELLNERAALVPRRLEGSDAWFAEEPGTPAPPPNSSFADEEHGLTKGTTELFCVSEPAAERGAVGVDERGVGSDRGCEAMAVCI